MVPGNTEKEEKKTTSMEDPMPNELDNALSQLIPAVKACSNPNEPKLYRDLNKFEQMAGTAPSWRALARASTGPGTTMLTNGGANGGTSGISSANSSGAAGRALLDDRAAGEVEVAFRHCMHEAAMDMVDQVMAKSGAGGKVQGGKEQKGRIVKALESSAPVGLLTLALDFATAEASKSQSLNKAIAALPMVLLEDFLESQGTERCKEIWAAWVEPNTTALTAPSLMVVGVYTLIRLCNKLAARMSKTYDSSFCGQAVPNAYIAAVATSIEHGYVCFCIQYTGDLCKLEYSIHLFLSKAVPFFDRSGLNVTGAVNATNKTEIEDEKAFQRAMVGFDGEDEAGATTGDGEAGMEGQGAAASGVVDAMAIDAGDGADGKGDFTVDYRLYQSFWRLQKYAMSQDAIIRGKDTSGSWKAFLHDVDEILKAFEANGFSEQDLRLAKQRWEMGRNAASAGTSSGSGRVSVATGGKRKRGHGGSGRRNGGSDGVTPMDVDGGTAGGGGVAGPGDDEENGEGGDGDNSYFGLKYLTSPRLLRLQLRDPSLRLQVLTQWLIVAVSLKSKIAKEKDFPHPVSDLNLRVERAKKLVKATPPRGEDYLRMLQTVLHRESAWTQWKDVHKCKAVESVASAEARAAAAAEARAAAAASSSKSGDAPVPAKRSKLSSSVAAAERAKHAPLDKDFALDKIVTQLRRRVPTSEAHLKDQRLCAQDPDTSADELPSANTLYAWRARRKLTAENLANLANCFDGDIVKAMARMDEAKQAAARAKEAAARAKEAAAKAKEDAAKAKEAAAKVKETAIKVEESTNVEELETAEAVATPVKSEAASTAVAAPAVAAGGASPRVDGQEERVRGNSGGVDGVGAGARARDGSKSSTKVKDEQILAATRGETPVTPSSAASTLSPMRVSSSPAPKSSTTAPSKAPAKDTGTTSASSGTPRESIERAAKSVGAGITPAKGSQASAPVAAIASPKTSGASRGGEDNGRVNGGAMSTSPTPAVSTRGPIRRSSRTAHRVSDGASSGGAGADEEGQA